MPILEGTQSKTGHARFGAENDSIGKAKALYFDFLNRCCVAEGAHRLTPAADASAFATCFWIYGMHLLRQDAIVAKARDELSRSLRRAVRNARAAHTTNGQLRSKSYRQLLAFTLSALKILGTLADDPLEDLVIEQLPQSVEQDLRTLGCLAGQAQSGNQAMFVAVFLLHARDHLALALDDRIEQWVRLHLEHMNRFGFWGPDRNMTSLQFQNGYHQYEIFEYLGIDTGKEHCTASAVAAFSDHQGHFAPYPGGGGCFDYDAVFMLTPGGVVPDGAIAQLLKLTSNTLLSEQQADGGFCESLYIRPRSLRNIWRSGRHILTALPNTASFLERLRYGIALQRRKYDRITTHWSQYARQWNESDLWDSWFRMLAVARIHCAMDQHAAAQWGFIDFPGIGYHPSLRVENLQS